MEIITCQELMFWLVSVCCFVCWLLCQQNYMKFSEWNPTKNPGKSDLGLGLMSRGGGMCAFLVSSCVVLLNATWDGWWSEFVVHFEAVNWDISPLEPILFSCFQMFYAHLHTVSTISALYHFISLQVFMTYISTDTGVYGYYCSFNSGLSNLFHYEMNFLYWLVSVNVSVLCMLSCFPRLYSN